MYFCLSEICPFPISLEIISITEDEEAKQAKGQSTGTI